jgi:hypothetical protein
VFVTPADIVSECMPSLVARAPLRAGRRSCFGVAGVTEAVCPLICFVIDRNADRSGVVGSRSGHGLYVYILSFVWSV